VLPADEGWAPETLADLAQSGARYYADPTGDLPEHPELLAWLAAHAQPLADGLAPALWRLRQAPALVDPGLSGSRERVNHPD
jgi:hypothetical protein